MCAAAILEIERPAQKDRFAKRDALLERIDSLKAKMHEEINHMGTGR